MLLFAFTPKFMLDVLEYLFGFKDDKKVWQVWIVFIHYLSKLGFVTSNKILIYTISYTCSYPWIFADYFSILNKIIYLKYKLIQN